MSAESFFTEVPGKWVLSGEHAVLKGATAIAFPHPEFKLAFHFQPQVWAGLTLLPPSTQHGVEACLRAAFEKVGADFLKIRGTLHVESSIPIGAGMGSSAALCVAIARWLGAMGYLREEHYFEFARSLEDRFHGKSSGMDVAAVLAGDGITYSLSQGAKKLSLQKTIEQTIGGLRVTFHDTGLRASTKDCVERVQALRVAQPELGLKLDEQMQEASVSLIAGLTELGDLDLKSAHERVQAVQLEMIQAIQKAQDCFRSWGLLPEAVQNLEHRLYEQGARAVKITGAGGGGFLVAFH